jgi:NAD-dependent SIR2 family protein deacetylase
MRMYECANCHSVLIVNETDERIANGDYYPAEKPDCPVCAADMIRVDREDLGKEDEGEA